MAITGQFRRMAIEKKAEFDPRKFLIPAMDEMTSLCRDRFERFGTAGHGSKIKVTSMDTMAERYLADDL